MKRSLLYILFIALILTSCKKPIAYPALQDMTEFRRNFSFGEDAFRTSSFEEGIIKSATIVLASLSSVETTDEGYVIYHFDVKKSIKNAAEDETIELYEPALEKGTLMYEKDQQYVLILARTTDICYEHPLFYTINTGRIIVKKDHKESLLTAEADGGKVDLKADLGLDTLSDLIAYIEKVRGDNMTIKDGVFGYHGRYLDSEDPLQIVTGSDYIVTMKLEKVLYENRSMRECQFEVKRDLKGTTDTHIIVTIPKYLEIRSELTYLACLFRDGNYTIAAKNSVISAEDTRYNLFLNAISSFKASEAAKAEERMALEKQYGADQGAKIAAQARRYTMNEAYKPYYEINEDVVGWFKIEDTVIDYPVLQGPDNEYYLEHDINKDPYVLGTIILDYRCDIKHIARNTMVYGHNAKNKSFFHVLTYYKDKDFFDKHPIIEFNTLYDAMKWQVFAVYVMDGGYGYCIDYPMEEDTVYAEHLQDIADKNMYHTDIEVGMDDKILTLVTCSYEFDNARTIVQAKLLEATPY